MPWRPRERSPRRNSSQNAFGLCLADVDADHLTMARLVNGVGNDQRFRSHVASVSNLEMFGVEPEIGELALQRPLAERVDALVELPTQRGDPVFAHAVDPELLDQPVDLAGRDTVDVGLHHTRNDRLLTRAPGLQKRRELRRPVTFAWDR